MSKSSTIEVDSNELSDDIMEDLVNDGVLDEEEAQEYADDVWFEEMSTPEPVRKISFSEKTQNAVEEYKRRFVITVLSRKSAFARVDSVSRNNNDNVEVVFSTDDRESVLSFDTDSSLLGSMLEYKGLNNPKSLEGEKFVLKESSHNSYVVIPCNVSSFGKLRYRFFCLVEGARRPTRIEEFRYDLLASMYVYSILCIFVGTVLHNSDFNSKSALLESGIDILGYSGIIFLVIPSLYLILRAGFYVLSYVLEGDFEQERL
jgi:polyhydroxyalkanoate synthesis regulator phasin